MSGFVQPRTRDHAPPDPRGILTSIGVEIYDWDVVADRASRWLLGFEAQTTDWHSAPVKEDK